MSDFRDDPIAIEKIEIFKNFSRGWKLMGLHMNVRPKGFDEWFYFLWGFDVWYGSVPLMKIIIASNLIMWVLMWVIL